MLMSSFCTLGILPLAGGVALSPHSQVSSAFDLCSSLTHWRIRIYQGAVQKNQKHTMLLVSVHSSETQGQAGNFFSLAAPSSLQSWRYRQQISKMVPKSPATASGGNVPSVPIEQALGKGSLLWLLAPGGCAPAQLHTIILLNILQVISVKTCFWQFIC